jgi:hypothetical protein
VAPRLPPPGKCFLLALSGYGVILLLLGVFQWRLGFLLAFCVVEFCSPGSSDGGCFPLVFVWAMVVVVSFFYWFISFDPGMKT